MTTTCEFRAMTATEMSQMFDENRHKERTKEVADFQKCVKDNAARFLALTDYGGIDGGIIDPESCERISKEVIYRVLKDFLELVVTGMPIGGHCFNTWNIGNMGSRWVDMNAKPYGLDYIRAAFYSKKDAAGEWPHKKPYAIHITCEKARR